MKIFIAGTDTNAGKTYVSCQLLKAFNSQGLSTFAIKPVAAGGLLDNGKIYNEDALALQAAASIKQDYDVVNPITFEMPVSPNIAAKFTETLLSKEIIIKKMAASLAVSADLTLIEGCGGWFVPINEKETMADVVKELNIPVILVVSIKLGCLNHSLLTIAAMQAMHIPCIGWIANCMQPEMLALEENITTLKNWIAAPCLDIVPLGGIISSESIARNLL